MIITDLKLQAKNKTRVNVFLDGVYYCGLDVHTALKNRLKTGVEISPERLCEIQREAELSACFNYAVKLISKTAKSESQIRAKLNERGYIKEIVDEVIFKLKDYGYIDDVDYAKRYLATYGKTKGKKLIAFELKRRGLSEGDINLVLSQIEGEFENALSVAKKYVKGKKEDKNLLSKCFKYLLSKGYSYEDAMSASRSVVTSEEEI